MKQTHGDYCSLKCTHLRVNGTYVPHVGMCAKYLTKDAFKDLRCLAYDSTANQIRRCAACRKEGER